MMPHGHHASTSRHPDNPPLFPYHVEEERLFILMLESKYEPDFANDIRC